MKAKYCFGGFLMNIGGLLMCVFAAKMLYIIVIVSGSLSVLFDSALPISLFGMVPFLISYDVYLCGFKEVFGNPPKYSYFRKGLDFILVILGSINVYLGCFWLFIYLYYLKDFSHQESILYVSCFPRILLGICFIYLAKRLISSRVDTVPKPQTANLAKDREDNLKKHNQFISECAETKF